MSDTADRILLAFIALREELEAVQFSGVEDHPDGGYYGACPSCGGGDPDNPNTPEGYEGHADDCSLAAALAKAADAAQPQPLSDDDRAEVLRSSASTG